MVNKCRVSAGYVEKPPVVNGKVPGTPGDRHKLYIPLRCVERPGTGNIDAKLAAVSAGKVQIMPHANTIPLRCICACNSSPISRAVCSGSSLEVVTYTLM